MNRGEVEHAAVWEVSMDTLILPIQSIVSEFKLINSSWRSITTNCIQQNFKSAELSVLYSKDRSYWLVFNMFRILWWWIQTSDWTHHCAGFLHCQRLVHRGRAVTGRKDEEWGTGRAEPWARGLPLGVAEGAECRDLRLPHWNHHGRGETSGSCLRETEEENRFSRLHLHPM